jgi:hypothetical protein
MINAQKYGVDKMISGKVRLFLSAVLIAALMSCVALADRDTFVSGASIRVSMISQDPDPVGPGDYVELRWMVTNMGSKPLEDVEFKLVADYPFGLLGNPVKALGTIQGHQDGEEGVVLYYKVRIDEDASEGTNKLYLMYRYRGFEEWAKLDYFDVRVQSVDAAVVIDSITMDPERIGPGTSSKLNIRLKNIADSVMRNVNVKLDLTLSSLPQPATGTEASIRFDALPFAPTGSSAEKRIPSMKPGEVKTVSFDLVAYPSAASRVYKLPVIVTYKDEIDAEYTKNEIVGVTVGSDPDIYVVIDSSDLVSGKKNGKVSFKFVNRGVTDLKFVDVLLEETQDYEIISAKEEYVGNIDSDDFETVDFTIYLSNNNNAKTENSVEFPIKITFKDANNIDYEKSVKLTHKIYTEEQKGIAQSRSAAIITIAVIAIIVIWLAYRFWERRRKKSQAK